MIDQRFSIQEFEARGRNTEAANELTRALQLAIAEEVSAELRAIAGRLAARLGELGHTLTETHHEVDPEGMASVTFADQSLGESPLEQRLRFNLDLIVSVGYPGYDDDDDLEDEISGLITP